MALVGARHKETHTHTGVQHKDRQRDRHRHLSESHRLFQTALFETRLLPVVWERLSWLPNFIPDSLGGINHSSPGKPVEETGIAAGPEHRPFKAVGRPRFQLTRPAPSAKTRNHLI